jgi:hypothetical protein
LRRILSSERSKRESGQTINAIYEIPCTECDEVYIGETERRVQTRLKEHCKRTDSVVHQHMVTKGHEIDFDSFRVRGQHSNMHERRIKETLFVSRAKCFNGCGGYDLSPFGRTSTCSCFGLIALRPTSHYAQRSVTPKPG